MARRRAPAPARFVSRHVGPSAQDTSRMLSVLGLGSLEELADALVPGGLPALPQPARPHPPWTRPASWRPCAATPPTTTRTWR